jgi:hypothetical protein
MKVSIRIHKDGAALYEGTHDVADADSFGAAWADIWTKLHEQRLARASSIGALFDQLNETLLDELHGAQLSLSKL